MWKSELEKILISSGLNKTVAQNALQNKKLSTRLQLIFLNKPNEILSKNGPLLYKIAAKTPPGFEHHIDFLTKYIFSGKLRTDLQIESALNFIKKHNNSQAMNIAEFEKECGIGILITREQISNEIAKIINQNNGKKITANFLQAEIRKKLKWVDSKIVSEEIKKNLDSQNLLSKAEITKNPEKTIKIQETPRLSKLLARDLPTAINPKHIIKLAKSKMNFPVITRFPPEPNGFLHIGHAKAMRYNFTLAEDYKGVCYLRYDDTNPEKESIEYVKSIEECVKWLGYKPYKITYASDYFDQLYEFAIKLIKEGKAYVCLQTKEEIQNCRAKCIESPYRNRPIVESLALFEKMKNGVFDEGYAVVRLKIDMKHPNPCMRDPVAYRVKHREHTRTGKKWCIYPTYDFTHCINDSLEWITHSCCTLEFEIRRDSYYWLLNALDIYRPYVYEYSRLNVSHNVLSKRLLKQLIEGKYVNGWDDPRLLTIFGLKRRGVSPSAINEFCDIVGVTRRGNEMVIPSDLLDHCIRKDLYEKAPRTMTVLNPLLVDLVNVDKSKFELLVKSKVFPNQNILQEYKLTPSIFIEKSDYQPIAGPEFRGLTKTQNVILKNAGMLKFVKEKKDSKGNLVALECEFEPIGKKPAKMGVLHWVSEKYRISCGSLAHIFFGKFCLESILWIFLALNSPRIFGSPILTQEGKPNFHGKYVFG